MDAIYGVTRELLVELEGKHSELKAKFGEKGADAEFRRYLATRGLDMGTFANAYNGWRERFRADPTGRAEAEYHMMLQEVVQKAHFGDVGDMSADVEEGVTLDQYVQITVAVSRQGADVDSVVRQFGLRDGAHWQRANLAWTQKMSQDTTHKLTTQFGQLYQKYAGPSFRQELVDQTASILAEANKPQDVIREPEEQLTAELCLRKMQSPSQKERWQYAGYYANMADRNGVPDKAAAVATVTPILVEMIERHDEHTTNDAEKGIRLLWDLHVRTDDVRGAAARCLGRAREKLTTLEAAFAPIQNQAVPERVTLQSRIQDYTSLVETMEDFLGRSWGSAAPPSPSPTSSPPVIVTAARPSSSGGFPRWIAVPLLLAIVGSGVVAMRSRAQGAAAADTASTTAGGSAGNAGTASGANAAANGTTADTPTPAAAPAPSPAASSAASAAAAAANPSPKKAKKKGR